MAKINNNISFTSKIIITSFPKFQALNGIRYGAREFITPCRPDKTTPILLLEKMVNKQTRTCTSINLIVRPKDSTDVFIKPIHLHHETNLQKLGPFLRRMIDGDEDIQSIIMWGYKNIKGYKGLKLFEKSLEILSKEKEVTYFKGHSLKLNAETNARYTNQGDIMYLAPKSWENPSLTPLNDTDMKNFYQDYHIAASERLIFNPPALRDTFTSLI